MNIEPEQMQEELKGDFERWYAAMLLIAPDIVPYKDILLLAYISGAINSAEKTLQYLDSLAKSN